MALVETDIADGVAVVTLNRPEAMNALSKALRAELAAVMVEMDRREDVRAVVLTGAGTRAFEGGAAARRNPRPAQGAAERVAARRRRNGGPKTDKGVAIRSQPPYP